MKRFTLAAAFVTSVVAGGAALAMPMGNLPPEETHGAVTYRTGGISYVEAQAMRQAEASYPLSLEFVGKTEPQDWFLADVEVTIKDQHGNIALKTFSDGPMLLAKLPDGQYSVTATDDGKSQTREVDVAAGKPQHLVFSW